MAKARIRARDEASRRLVALMRGLNLTRRPGTFPKAPRSLSHFPICSEPIAINSHVPFIKMVLGELS
jgi:hypothetical protein